MIAMSRLRLRTWVLVVPALWLGPQVRAAGNLPSEDPAWDELRDAIAEGRVPDPLGGVQSLDAERAFAALSRGRTLEGVWATPLDRAILRAFADREHDRAYSLPARERQLAGFIALSCEYQEGRPCGDGASAGIELDSAAGFGDLLTAATRIRLAGGSATFGEGLALDRAYVKLEYGPLLLQVGRDVLALGPSVRAAEMVSDNAVPQDGIRAQLHPVALPFAPWLRVSLFYFLDRLRDPQTFHGTLLDCTRAQFDFADRVQLGGSRLLQLGGKGAPDYGGLWGFIDEHFGRAHETGYSTAENNRLSFDLSVRFPELRGARVYYEIAFEDTRKRFFNMLQYDADHLLGIEVRALRLGPWRRLFIELQHTGWVSQEHSIFKTGMTNSGRTLGSALGPDGLSLWVRADVEIAGVVVSPWVEWLRFVSDIYGSDQEHGVFVTAVGTIEHRQRVGADVQAQLARGLRLSASLFGERVGNADLVEGATKFNAGLRAALAYTP
jgi:hypothetical protein